MTIQSVETEENKQIDESLYSRTLYVLGHDAMEKMASSKVLIIGLSGVGLEVAKNIVLSGVNNIVFLDDEVLTVGDTGTNFYLNDSAVPYNTTRADFLKGKVSELNPNASITSVSHSELSEIYLVDSKFTVVVVVNQSLTNAITYSRWCRKNSIRFVQTSTIGLFANCFVDFGESFTVTDKNGEELSRSIVDMDRLTILKHNDSLEDVKIRVYINHRSSHKLQDGDCVRFEPSIFPEAFDQNELLGPIEVINTHCIEILCPNITAFDSSSVSIGTSESTVELVQAAHPTTFKSETFEEAITDWSSQFNNCPDFARMESIPALHACYLHLTERDRVNIPDTLQQFIVEVNATANAFGFREKLNSNTLALVFNTYNGEVGPINSVMGGFVAQEVLKLCGHKFTPLMGWLYIDFHDILNESQVNQIVKQEVNTEPTQSITPRLKRLTDAVGTKLVQKLSETRLFMVGSGAIGCEHLKNFAMLNIATSPNGKVILTDMDTIEKSNLSRQFLFRSRHVGANKAVTAKEAVLDMNPRMNIEAHQNIVSKDTEATYSNEFFQSQTVIVNALDNIEARRYVDGRCVENLRPLFESGTLGTKGNTQVVLPHLTESYGASHDPPEESVPQCTLKNFPHKIEHTIAFARNLFEGLFNKSIETVKGYISDPDYYFDSLTSQYEQEEAIDVLKCILQKHYPSDFTDCIRWALDVWLTQFRNQIIQLIASHPEDQKTTEGQAFWSGTKRFPTPHAFDSANDLHLDFIIAAANLWAKIFNVTPNRFTNRKVIAHIANEELKHFPEFIPNKNLFIPGNDEEAKKLEAEKKKERDNTDSKNSDKFDLEKERDLLPSITSAPLQKLYENLDNFNPEEFEKDDPTNFHIDFITAASNLRAANYRIDPVSAFETKKIAGKIIPAIATTTAIVSGLITIELMKYVNGIRDVEKYRNFFLNLALPMVTSSEPDPPEYQDINGKKCSYWDQIEMDSDMTVEQIVSHISETFDIDVDMISKGTKCLYSDMFGTRETRERKKKMTLFQIAKEIALKDGGPDTEAFQDILPSKTEIYEVLGSVTPDDPEEELRTYSVQIRMKPTI